MERMKKSLSVLLMFIACSICFMAISSASEDEALVSRGKELFNAKEGLNTKIACIFCHKGEKAIPAEKIQALGDTLPDTINTYIVEKAKGTALAKDSEEMKSLVAYLRSDRSK